ncbi:FG-GAP repeat domain-containing protein [Algoriphagus mannitolivorans]|uniref:FG-GAP repeat domain-containing protein n=1 Tax=Algoriphagus mannitolivorans TaxID=226504 RepID=UPI0004262DAA|nr:VCBS repeat-containing protein [Algoriphagus mannitolivorans]
MRRIWKVLAFLSLAGCGQIGERKQPPPSLYQLSQSDLNLSGEQLANGYCAACHVKPEPQVLDKKTWEKLLPDMRKRMGLYLPEDFGTTLPEDEGVPEGIYSKTQMISRENWEKLVAYYLENAPENPLPQEKKLNPIPGIPGFEVQIPSFEFIRPSLTTMLKIHPETGHLWLGHRFRALFVLDPKNNFRQLDSIPTDVAPAELLWKDQNSFQLLTMGLMDPANDSLGTLSLFQKKGIKWDSQPVISNMMRPVHVEVADWNKDGKEDFAVAQFGNHLGKFSLFLSGSQGYSEIDLKKDPGARRSIAVDFDQDRDLDILVQMTQAKESILLFENQGEGKFREETLLAFQPAFGSSDFKFEDMDGDGFKDIVLVNGDNADQSQILKYYHGVRIFKNDGKGKFEEHWFYPMYGASGLEIGDFDQDGDQDLVVISFFPDPMQKPRQDLVYFENTSGGFRPYSLAQNAEFHWLTITKGDLDLDGDLDLVIGGFEFNQLYQAPRENWKPFLILKNTKK